MLGAVERRFGSELPASPVEWLTDNGSCYRANETRQFARMLGLEPKNTAVRSPESNGIAESFVKTIKRDYISVMPKPDGLTAAKNLAEAFEHYNEWHPHSALGYRSPREYLRQRGANRVAGAIRQCRDVCRRHVHTPAPVVLNGSAVAFAVKQHGHHCTCGKVRSGAAQGQRTARFGGVNNIIAADGADRERHCRRVYLYVVRLGAAVACAIGDSGADSHCAICKAGNHAGRHADAPVAAGIGAGDILLPGDGHHQTLQSSSASSCSICATLSTRGCQLLFSSLRTFMPKVMLSRTDRCGNRA